MALCNLHVALGKQEYSNIALKFYSDLIGQLDLFMAECANKEYWISQHAYDLNETVTNTIGGSIRYTRGWFGFREKQYDARR